MLPSFHPSILFIVQTDKKDMENNGSETSSQRRDREEQEREACEEQERICAEVNAPLARDKGAAVSLIYNAIIDEGYEPVSMLDIADNPDFSHIMKGVREVWILVQHVPLPTNKR